MNLLSFIQSILEGVTSSHSGFKKNWRFFLGKTYFNLLLGFKKKTFSTDSLKFEPKHRTYLNHNSNRSCNVLKTVSQKKSHMCVRICFCDSDLMWHQTQRCGRFIHSVITAAGHCISPGDREWQRHTHLTRLHFYIMTSVMQVWWSSWSHNHKCSAVTQADIFESKLQH